jgi:gas vesicle protein
MQSERRTFNKNISKGGLIGAIAGSIVSIQFHNKDDKPLNKAAKISLFVTLGYLLGSILEKIFRIDKKV